MLVPREILFVVAAIPFIYYLIALFSSWRFFRKPDTDVSAEFTPPVSILKPIRGLDPGAFENLAGFCTQDYPEYELVFCVDADDAAVVSVLDRLVSEFPDTRIRILYGSGRLAANDKVAKLVRLTQEAAYEHLVISDSDVRVRPDYLRNVVAPLSNPKVGATTCMYVPSEVGTLTDRIQTVGMMSDFYAGVLVDWQLEGIKFALGPSIVTTRTHLNGFGGYARLENGPADDLLVGRLIAEQGLEVVLVKYPIQTVCDYNTFSELLHKRMRWMVVMRHMRPAGHLGLIFTLGLPWALLAFAAHPVASMAWGYLGTYALLRMAMAWLIGIRGLSQNMLWKQLPLIPVWDAVALGIWLGSFLRSTIRWRGADYYIRGGQLIPVSSMPSGAPVRATN